MSQTRKVYRPWGDYLFRVVACVLLLGASFGLLAQSTFAQRLRDDVPAVAGMSGAQTLALVISAVLALQPLLWGRRFLGAFLVSSFLASLVGAYWWTRVMWDELVSESNFVVEDMPGLWDYVLTALPAIIAVFYVAASRASRLKAEYRNRGVEPDQITKAACASYLAGVLVFFSAVGLSVAFWAVLASGALFGVVSSFPTGIPAIVLAAALLTVGIALGGGRLPKAKLTRPSKAGAGLAARVRSLTRRSPF